MNKEYLLDSLNTIDNMVHDIRLHIVTNAHLPEDEGNYIVWSDGRKTQIEDEELLQYIAENIQQEASDAPKV